MPARIVIVDAAATEPPERWIEKPFLTVGTAAGSDVTIAAAAGTEAGLYVQFRDGRYEVFNKQASGVEVGGLPVPQGRSAAWEPGTELTVAGRRLRLEVDGDPTPASRPLAAAPVAARRSPREADPRPAPAATARPGATPRPEQQRGKGVGLRLAVTIGCVAASALILLKDRLPTLGGGPVAETAGFDALVNEAFDTAATAQPAADMRRRLARRLQWAEAAWLAGEWRLAGERYATLERYLAGSRFAADGADTWRSRLAAHVNRRLADLAKRPTIR